MDRESPKDCQGNLWGGERSNGYKRFDRWGASELAVPEELAAEEAIIEAGEVAAEETAEVGGETAAEAASEKQALRVAKQIEKDLGKDARREFHDEKLKGAGDRSMQQLKDDARAVYEDHGKTPPEWLK